MKRSTQIAEFGQKLMALGEVDNALELIADEAKQLLNADRCSIFIVDAEDKMLWTKLADGIGRIVIALDSGIVGDTYMKNEPQLVNNPYEDERFLPNIDKKSGYVTRNIITTPIYNSKREIIGIIQLLNKSRGDFDEKDLEDLAFLANYVSGSLELILMSEK
jgi:GAF domain-containing protein